MGRRGLQLGSHRSSEPGRREWAVADCSWGAIEVANQVAENGPSRIAAEELSVMSSVIHICQFFCHSYLSFLLACILSFILSFLSVISSGIHSVISSVILIWHFFWHSFCHFFCHSYLAFLLSCLLSFLSGISSVITSVISSVMSSVIFICHVFCHFYLSCVLLGSGFLLKSNDPNTEGWGKSLRKTVESNPKILLKMQEKKWLTQKMLN